MVSLRRRKNKQASASTSATDEEPQLPEGWRVVDHEKCNGEVVKVYKCVMRINVLNLSRAIMLCDNETHKLFLFRCMYTDHFFKFTKSVKEWKMIAQKG